MRVCVTGLGEVGLPTALYIQSRGLKVQGYDIKKSVVKKAEEHNVESTSNWGEISAADVYVVCVSTLLKGKSPDLMPVFDVCGKINEKTESSTLVSIESTIPPGTSRKIYDDIFEGELFLVHTPHRYWIGDSERHGVNQKRVIGGVNKESLKKGLEFYRDRLHMLVSAVPSAETAELCKIAENTYRYIQIAFAEELKMVSEELGIDFERLRQACNTKWNIEVLEARDGIGGHCLYKDVKYYSNLSDKTHLPESAINVDEAYRKWLKENKSKVGV